MMGRALLIMVIAMYVVSLMISKNVSRTLGLQNDNVFNYNGRISARNMAESGIQVGLRQLAYTRTSRATIVRTMGGGVDSVMFKDTFYLGRSVVKISSVARIIDKSTRYALYRRDTSFACAVFVPKAWVPGNAIHGAVTTNNPTTISGSIIIDGRDHDTTGATVIAGSGTFGVWTTSTLTFQGSEMVGGTNIRRQDFAPSNPGDTSVVRQNQSSWGYPTTPDSVLGGAPNGYPEGTLKAVALSRVNGSQYVTDPTLLQMPLKGVTYIEPPSGVGWSAADITGSGILVVHNSTRDAVVKNVHGTFTGLVIVDDISHTNATLLIVGAVFGLTPVTSATNDFGNGNASILYSSSVIANVISAVKPDSVSTYANKVLAWWE